MIKQWFLLGSCSVLGAGACISPIIISAFNKSNIEYKFIGINNITTKTGSCDCYVLENGKPLNDISFTSNSNELWFENNLMRWKIKEAKEINIECKYQNSIIFNISVKVWI